MAGVSGFDHIAFPVSDLAKATEFYDRLFGAQLRSEYRVDDEVLIRRIAIGKAVLSLHRSGNGIALVAKSAAIGCADFCLSWDGTIEEAAALLRERDVEVVHGPLALRTAAGRPAHSIYFRDPDGNLVEIMAEDPLESDGSDSRRGAE